MICTSRCPQRLREHQDQACRDLHHPSCSYTTSRDVTAAGIAGCLTPTGEPETNSTRLLQDFATEPFGAPSDVANAVTYFASAGGGFITGETLIVDGGNQIWGDRWTIPRPAYFDGQQPSSR